MKTIGLIGGMSWGIHRAPLPHHQRDGEDPPRRTAFGPGWSWSAWTFHEIERCAAGDWASAGDAMVRRRAPVAGGRR